MTLRSSPALLLWSFSAVSAHGDISFEEEATRERIAWLKKQLKIETK